MIRKLTVIALLALLLGGCAATAPQENYQGEVAGIPVTFSYPDGWTVLDLGGNVLAVTRDDHTGVTIASGLPFNPTPENMDVMLYSVFNRYATFMNDMVIVAESADIRVDGTPARLLVFEGTEVRGETNIPIHFYLIAGGDETVDFSIEARAYQLDWEDVEADLLGIIDTINFD